MAGLCSFLSGSQTTQTTLPAWYCQAQQNIVNQGNTAFASAPQLGQTVAQGAINTLSGSNNPFTQAQGTLNQISSGAANPWIVCGSTGTVTPNVNTPLGGLFAAQNQQLKQNAANIMDPVTAGGTGAGQFGSLRTQTAADKALACQQAQLFAQQMNAALTNQQVGTTAAAQLGNVGQQGVNAAMNVGMQQQNAPFQNIGNLASLISTIQAPTTVTSTKNMSGLCKINALAKLATGTGSSNLLSSALGALGLGGSGANNAAKVGILGALASALGLKSMTGGSGTSGNGLCCAALSKCIFTGYCKSSCGNLIVCKNDQSGQYCGSSCTPTSTGCTTQQDICNAVSQGGYTSYNPNICCAKAGGLIGRKS